jgi:hypothetical protein
MRQRLRTVAEIEKAVIETFKKDYPGEPVHGYVFSTYILDCYCRTAENYALCRQMLMRGVDIDL